MYLHILHHFKAVKESHFFDDYLEKQIHKKTSNLRILKLETEYDIQIGRSYNVSLFSKIDNEIYNSYIHEFSYTYK